MSELALLDNDVALKVACYSLADELLAATTIDGTPPGMLGVGRFVIRGRLERGSNVSDAPRARIALENLLGAVEFFEPTVEELNMAADLEAEAQRRDLELDGGESQLISIVAIRKLHILITGDKRAIAAMAVVASEIAASRIVCLEQLMAVIIDLAGVGAVRPRVCAEPRIDRAITACFACTRDSVGREEVAAGLSSYIGHLNKSAPGVLMHTYGVGKTT